MNIPSKKPTGLTGMRGISGVTGTSHGISCHASIGGATGMQGIRGVTGSPSMPSKMCTFCPDIVCSANSYLHSKKSEENITDLILFMRKISAGKSGGVVTKLLEIFKEKGSNSKTLLKNLFEHFGCYINVLYSFSSSRSVNKAEEAETKIMKEMQDVSTCPIEDTILYINSECPVVLAIAKMRLETE